VISRLDRVALALSLCAVACAPAQPAGSDASAPREASLSADASPPADASAPEAGEIPAMCNAPTTDVLPAGSACVRAVEGRAVSDDGAPLAGQVITVCGSACFAATTDAQGRFVVSVGEVLPVPVYSVHVHGRPARASAYWPLPAPDATGIARFPDALSVPRYTSTGPELPEAMRVTSRIDAVAGPVTLTFSAGSRVEFDLEDFELAALGRTVRVAEVPLDRAPPFARDGMLRGPVFALGPFALVSDQPVGVRIPNRAMLPAGASVDFVAMGREVLPPDVDAARPVVVARGTVSADGATIATAPGEGPRSLTWIGVRPR
jgi:hypothetical protein